MCIDWKKRDVDFPTWSGGGSGYGDGSVLTVQDVDGLNGGGESGGDGGGGHFVWCWLSKWCCGGGGGGGASRDGDADVSW